VQLFHELLGVQVGWLAEGERRLALLRRPGKVFEHVQQQMDSFQVRTESSVMMLGSLFSFRLLSSISRVTCRNDCLLYLSLMKAEYFYLHVWFWGHLCASFW